MQFSLTHLMLGNISYLTQPVMPCLIKSAEVLKLEKVMKHNLFLCNTARRKVIVASSAPFPLMVMIAQLKEI